MNKKIVGVTGGIGSGKTFVCRILEAMGYPVFYSDRVAKQILITKKSVKEKIISVFGALAYLETGELNKPYLSKQIFSNKKLLEQMNSIVHPIVKKEFEQWICQQNASIIFYESAILFESNSYKNFDKIILITASKQTKIKRLLKRDNSTIEAIEKRMNNQWADEKKIPLADYIIVNDENSMILEQVNEVLKNLLLIVNHKKNTAR